jgi:hypothetical protein
LPPPQLWPLGQLPLIAPQVSAPVLQPLSMTPQLRPAGHEVSGVQLAPQVPFEVLQVWPTGQAPAMVPQLTIPPQPSGMVPHTRVPHAADAVMGVQPHWLGSDGVPPPQVAGAVQPPQV